MNEMFALQKKDEEKKLESCQVFGSSNYEFCCFAFQRNVGNVFVDWVSLKSIVFLFINLHKFLNI